MTEYRVWTNYNTVRYIEAETRHLAVSKYVQTMTTEEESDLVFIMENNRLYKYYLSSFSNRDIVKSFASRGE